MIQVKRDFGEFRGVSDGNRPPAGAPEIYRKAAIPKPPDDIHVPVFKSNLTLTELKERKHGIDRIYFLACSEWSTDERLLYEQKIRYLNMSISEVNFKAHTWLARSCLGGIRLVFKSIWFVQSRDHRTANKRVRCSLVRTVRTEQCEQRTAIFF